MVKNSELRLPKINKAITFVSVIVILLMFSIVIYAATSSKTVNIYDGENVITLNTKLETVSDVLAEKEIVLGRYDDVVPALEAVLTNNMDIKVCRAVNVKITENGNTVETVCAGPTVFDLLTKNGIHLTEHDIVVPERDTVIKGDIEILVNRAKEISFVVGDQVKTVYTCFDTVGEVCADAGYEISDDCKANYRADEVIVPGMKVEVFKHTYEVLTTDEIIPFDVDARINPSLNEGAVCIVQEGINGKKTTVTKISYVNGVETSRQILSSGITQNPVTEIKEIGASKAIMTSRGEIVRYSKVIKCTATAYDLSYASCGKNPGDRGYGITASGMKAQYGVIAVDPRVIPLGTRLYVEAYDGNSWTYGYCIAGDTGGAIKGNRIDLFYDSHSEAIQFGRRAANVYVLQ